VSWFDYTNKIKAGEAEMAENPENPDAGFNMF
jgi:hypothetical protein